MAAQGRIGILPAADRQAIFNAAQQLQLDPYEFGGLLSLESGANMDPNIWGGGGGKYYGMIQFGPSERARYLDPSRVGKYTRAEQIPKAVQFLLDRGYKPGMGIEKAYATILGGNPGVSLQAKDSFGTSVAGAVPRFRSGGDLYRNAQRVLGDPLSGAAASSPSGQTTQASQTTAEPGTFAVKTRRMPVQNAAAFQSLIGEIQRGFGGGGSTGDDKLYAAMVADAAGDPSAPELLKAALSEPDSQSSGFNLNNLAKRFIEAATPQYVTDWEITPNGASTAPTATQPNAGPAQRLAVGRVVDPSKDVLPSTGAHLDVRVLKDGQYINPEIARSVLKNLYVGDKPLYSQVGEEWRPGYAITSRFGPRSAPTAGASTYHRGVDFGVPAGTQLEWRGGGTYKPERGYGVIQTGGPYEIRLLHTTPS